MEDGILHQTEGWPLGVIKLSFSKVGLPFVGMGKNILSVSHNSQNFWTLFWMEDGILRWTEAWPLGVIKLSFSEVGLPFTIMSLYQDSLEDVKLKKNIIMIFNFVIKCIWNPLITPDEIL